MSAPSELSPEARRGVLVVWLVIFVDLLGFGIVLPSLAYYVHLYAVPAEIEGLGRRLGMPDTRAVFVGLLQTAYSLMQFVFAPFWGSISDRVGRRPILLLSMAGFSLAWVVFGNAPTLGWLLLARALAGAMGANISTAQAYVADVYPPERRARGMGLIGMAFGFGFVFGPAIGALLVSDTFLGQFSAPGSPRIEQLRLWVPSMFAAALSLLAFLLGLWKLPESLPPERRRRAAPRGRVAELKGALSRPYVGPMLGVYFVVILGFSGLETMFSEFNLQHLHLPASINGLVFTAIGVSMAVVQGGLVGPWSERLGAPRLLQIGLFALAVAMAIFGLQVELNPGISPTVWVGLVSILVGASFSFCNPTLLGILSGLSSKDAQGEAMGITVSAATLGRIAGPLIGGLVYARVGPEWPFVLGAALVALAGLLLWANRPGLVRALSSLVAPSP
ncbi:MAG: MFS transporter [Deltaproteobacteria bacterium]|jgi:DHA1 family tetracycline resistance protein-like MFS transporter|nr:MFS transporter [Deltaproteobacteria bacterium]